MADMDTQTGEIKRLIKQRGFGFIRHEETREDLFFHASEVVNIKFEDLAPGDRVVFLIRGREDKRYCIDVF